MNFEDWMRHKGLSESSVLKYEGAIRGVLTEWAVDNNLLEGPLSSIKSLKKFENIASQIRNLPIYLERNDRGHSMYNAALKKYAEYVSEGYDSNLELDIESIVLDSAINATEKITLINSRIGQGAFRQKQIRYWKYCSVTGFKDVNMLVASHIKPWSASNNFERLDVFNGLLLTPNLDKLFDAGFVTFEENGKIKISPQLTEPEKLGVRPDLMVRLLPEHEKYMSFHRSVVYRKS